jgi:hypothetical protein
MKIVQHPRMRSVAIGDEVYYRPGGLHARVTDVFPAAVCVRLAVLSLGRRLELREQALLWRADDIENLSVCRVCGGREGVAETGAVRLCTTCERHAAYEGEQTPDGQR